MNIMGHRGGFAPQNSLASFTKAIEHGLSSIELDVWLTCDKQLLVLHGGDSGEVHLEDQAELAYVFELTLAENRAAEPAFVLPTLAEVIAATDKRTFINIEMKTPWNEEVRARYNQTEAAEALHQLLRANDMGDHCFVSSFNAGGEMLPAIEKLNAETGYHVRTVYLYNFYPECKLPPLEELVQSGDGINISYEELSEEVVAFCHANNKVVMVWIDTSVTTETVELYRRLIDLGVDAFCSDWPLQVTQLRDALMSGDLDLDKIELPSLQRVHSG